MVNDPLLARVDAAIREAQRMRKEMHEAIEAANVVRREVAVILNSASEAEGDVRRLEAANHAGCLASLLNEAPMAQSRSFGLSLEEPLRLAYRHRRARAGR